MVNTKEPELHNKFSEGFTLVELLVAIAIIGILSAIALPIYLWQIQKAKQVEPKIYTASCLRVQQAVSTNTKYTVNATLYKSQNPEELVQAVICCVATSKQQGDSSYAQALVYTNTNQVVSTTCDQVASVKP
jgi:type IV pilus assembly protein PilE